MEKKEKMLQIKLDNENIKNCKKCKREVKKKDGGNHIICKCGVHLCWICCAIFHDANACQDHLGLTHKDPQFARANDDNEGFIPIWK